MRQDPLNRAIPFAKDVDETPGQDSWGEITAYIAIPIFDRVIVDELIELQQMLKDDLPAGFPVDWQAHDDFHITLRYLGKTSPHRAFSVMTESEKQLAHHQEFDLFLDKLGVFPDWDNPGVVWCGVSGDMEVLYEIQSIIDDAVREIGFPPADYEYSPHITLGYFEASDAAMGRNRTAVVNAIQNLFPERKEWTVSEIFLASSQKIDGEYVERGLAAIYLSELKYGN